MNFGNHINFNINCTDQCIHNLCSFLNDINTITWVTKDVDLVLKHIKLNNNKYKCCAYYRVACVNYDLQ